MNTPKPEIEKQAQELAAKAWWKARTCSTSIHGGFVVSEELSLHQLLADQERCRELEKENNILRGLVSRVGKSCHYCGLTNMGECRLGFPGCSLADDIMAGDEEYVQHLKQERDQLRAELALAKIPTTVDEVEREEWRQERNQLRAELELARKCFDSLGTAEFSQAYDAFKAKHP